MSFQSRERHKPRAFGFRPQTSESHTSRRRRLRARARLVCVKCRTCERGGDAPLPAGQRMCEELGVKITALKLQARNKSRVNVFVDGSFAFGLVKNEAVRLRIGQELTEADVERLKAADAREEAYARALRLIDRRPRSTREVADNLKKNKVAPEDIEAAIARLGRAGLLNDAEFAKMWVENREAFRPSSKRALALELRRKGVADSEIKVAVAESNDAAAADRVAQTKAARFAKLPWPEFRLKLLGVLARRGFDFDTARSAVERAWKTATGGRAPGDFDE